jgi:hypothetical protein
MFGIDPSNLLKSLEQGAEQEIISEVKKHTSAIKCAVHNTSPTFKGITQKPGGGWSVQLGYCCDDQKNQAEAILKEFNLL